MDDHLHRFVHRLEESELTLDDYFQASGSISEQFLDDLRQQAEMSMRNQLVLEAVAKDAGIDVTLRSLGRDPKAAARSGDPVAYLQAFRQSGRELARPVIFSERGRWTPSSRQRIRSTKTATRSI